MAPAQHPTLEYDRSRLRKGMFAGRFVALAAVGLVFGFTCLLVDGASLFVFLVRLVRRSGGVMPYDVVSSALRVVLDVLLLVGCAATLWRRPWSRRLLSVFVKGQVLDAAVTAFALIALWLVQYGVVHIDRRFLLATLLLFAVRCGFAWALLAALRGMHADFYFGTAAADDTDGVGPPRTPLPTNFEQRPARFRIRGRDAATGQEVDYRSQAKTEQLARKAAVALGLEPESVQIDPIDGTVPAATPPPAAQAT